MTAALRFDPIRLPSECEQLRKEVRAFLAEEIAAGTFDPHQPNREDTDVPEFSRKVGARGWLGMTWPKKYGGHERSFLERYVVTEEMRVANAPTRRFFVADRQSGPVLLKYAPENIKMDILPRICRGEVCFAIGMSEPNSGSDLFAAKTRATKTDGGYLINGTKIWTSSAHIADYMIAIFRTSPPTKENRRHGLTQFLVKMKQPGIQVNPIGQITGQYEFNEVVFTDFFVPDDHVLGEIDGAWKQATVELAYERSGPERFLETYYVLTELVRAVGNNPDTRSAEGIGRLVAQVHTMRRMSVSVAGMLQAGKEPVVEASIVKDIGTVWEQQLPHRVRELAAFVEETATNRETLEHQLSFAIKTAPKLTIQGGTTEVLRGIIARGLGLALIQRGNLMTKYTDIGVEKHGHVGLIEIQQTPAELLRRLPDQPDRGRAGRVRQGHRNPRLGARSPRQGVLRRRRFLRSEAAGAGSQRAKGPGGNLPINHLYVQAVRIFRNKKPVVAAVHGAAIGGGLGLAVSADFRVTCPEARFAANFTKLGFHPGFGLTATLPELVGKNNAELIFYTSRRVTGEEATRMGLANLCVPQDQVRAEAMKLAAEIAECSPLGLISTRATMRAGLADRVMAATNHELAEQTKLRATEDFKEGVKATAERRVANFKGR